MSILQDWVTDRPRRCVGRLRRAATLGALALALSSGRASALGWSGSGMTCQGRSSTDRTNSAYNDYGFFNESTTTTVNFFCDAALDAAEYGIMGDAYFQVWDRDSTAAVTVDMCFTDYQGFSRVCYPLSSGVAYVGFATLYLASVGAEDARVYVRGGLPKKTANGNSILTWYNYQYFP